MRNIAFLQDDFAAGVIAAAARTKDVPSGPTLVDLLPDGQWEIWDCSDENPTVADAGEVFE